MKDIEEVLYMITMVFLMMVGIGIVAMFCPETNYGGKEYDLVSNNAIYDRTSP